MLLCWMRITLLLWHSANMYEFRSSVLGGSWEVILGHSYLFRQCFLLCVIIVTGFRTTSGFSRSRGNLGRSLVILDKNVICSMSPTLKNYSDIRARGWVILWCENLWSVLSQLSATLSDLWMPVTVLLQEKHYFSFSPPEFNKGWGLW